MKLILVIFLGFLGAAIAGGPRCTKENEEYRICGPTFACDNQICQGAKPICTPEQAEICVEGCFCKPGFSRFGGECINPCPLLP